MNRLIVCDFNSSLAQFVCAKLVNVTGTCRRGRGFLIDEPVILTFDDELDETIENELRHMLHPQFVPSRTLEYILFVLLLDRKSFSSYSYNCVKLQSGSDTVGRVTCHAVAD